MICGAKPPGAQTPHRQQHIENIPRKTSHDKTGKHEIASDSTIGNRLLPRVDIYEYTKLSICPFVIYFYLCAYEIARISVLVQFSIGLQFSRAKETTIVDCYSKEHGGFNLYQRAVKPCISRLPHVTCDVKTAFPSAISNVCRVSQVGTGIINPKGLNAVAGVYPDEVYANFPVMLRRLSLIYIIVAGRVRVIGLYIKFTGSLSPFHFSLV